MKPLENYMQDFMNRKYQISYDLKPNQKEFTNHEEAILHILKILKRLGAVNVSRPCQTTIIADIKSDNWKRILKELETQLITSFYFSILLVAKAGNEDIIECLPNKSLDEGVKEEFTKLKL